jgi:hypothetical protein
MCAPTEEEKHFEGYIYTWINGKFPFIHWNFFNQHQPRTNNHVEGWHSRMNKVISKPHPNIFAWIEYERRQ